MTKCLKERISEECLLFKVLYLWSRPQKSLPPEFLMHKVLLWQRAGYVSKDVWNEMDKIVSPEFLRSQEESDLVLDFVEEVENDHVTDESLKLCGSDVVSDPPFGGINGSNDRFPGLLIHPIATNLYPSKRKNFALHALGLKESEYDQIITETEKRL